MSGKFFILTDRVPESVDIETITEMVCEYYPRAEYKGELKEYVDFPEYKSFCNRIQVHDTETSLEQPVPLYDEHKSYNTPEKTHPEMFDGIWMQRKLRSVIGKWASFSGNETFIVLTGLLTGTFGERRYHARAVILGNPGVISTAGIVEGPARKSEYYWIKARMIQSGMDPSELDEIYRGEYLTHDDERFNPVISSYILQVIAFWLSGKAFCKNNNCCLYNSHWQKEVLDLQFCRKMCESCKFMFKSFKDNY